MFRFIALSFSVLLVLSSTPACAFSPHKPVSTMVTVAFTPGDDAAGKIVSAIKQAQKEILVQLYSITHRDITHALIEAKRNGIDVLVIADYKQSRDVSQKSIKQLIEAKVPIWLDNQHNSAHNKIMIIDADSQSSVLVTGSFNFTFAAQYRNAENVLILQNNTELTRLYKNNWQTHLRHSKNITTL